MSKDPSEELDIGHHARRGTAWMVAMRWAVRLLGLLSTIVLARLLNPEDFGLFALSVLLIGLAELMGKAGQDMAVIRERDLSREYLDSAWTASILIGFAFGIVLILVAPWIAALFHEPRAELLVQILSARVFLMGFENIGVALFRRDLDFAKDFRFGVYEKLAQVVVTITLAVMFRNYWALVLGAIFGMMIAIAISYVSGIQTSGPVQIEQNGFKAAEFYNPPAGSFFSYGAWMPKRFAIWNGPKLPIWRPCLTASLLPN